MSVVWEDGSVGGFCDFPSWEPCIVSLLGTYVALVIVGLLPVCGPTTHNIYPQSHSSLVTSRHSRAGAPLPGGVFWLALISISWFFH